MKNDTCDACMVSLCMHVHVCERTCTCAPCVRASVRVPVRHVCTWVSHLRTHFLNRLANQVNVWFHHLWQSTYKCSLESRVILSLPIRLADRCHVHDPFSASNNLLSNRSACRFQVCKWTGKTHSFWVHHQTLIMSPCWMLAFVFEFIACSLFQESSTGRRLWAVLEEWTFGHLRRTAAWRRRYILRLTVTYLAPFLGFDGNLSHYEGHLTQN